MKAPSVILGSVQHPPSVYGVPLGMALMDVLAASAAGFAGFYVVGSAVLGVVGFAAALAAGLVRSWRARARDPHIEVVRKAHMFWWRGLRGRFWRGWRREFRHLAVAKP